MKILVVSQYYTPEPFRVSDVCQDLVRRGHRVTVLCGIPNYPSGRFYPGYSLLKRREETLDGVRVIRSWLVPRGKGGPAGLAMNYLSFLVSAWLRHFKLARQGFDAVFCYEVSPLTMALPALAVARRAGVPFTLYLTDLWPENVEAVNGIKNRKALNAIGRMAGYLYRRSDRILIPSRLFADSMQAWGADPARIVYWPQYAEDFYTPSAKATETPKAPTENKTSALPPETLDRSGFPVVFTGNIGVAQGLDVLIEAARLLADLPQVGFYLVGDGRARKDLEARVVAAGPGIADRIVFCGRVPGEKVPDYLARAGAALLTMAPDPVFSLYLPTKLQSYLASGLPILCAADGAAQQMVLDAKAGLAVPSGDAAGLAAAVRRMAAMPQEERSRMGLSARAYAEREFSKVRLMDELEYWLANPLFQKGKG